MRCNHCSEGVCIRKGKRGFRQRFRCKTCNKYQQHTYTYRRYAAEDAKLIRMLHSEGLGVRSIARVTGYSAATIIRKLLFFRAQIFVPVYYERNQEYEVDEIWTHVGKNTPENHRWITIAINRRTRSVIDIAIGHRDGRTIGKVIRTLHSLQPKKIITDKLPLYRNLVAPCKHDTRQYANNRIERANLTLRTHLKRLNRETICFSRSEKMLEASVLVYLDHRNWCLRGIDSN